MRYQLYSCLKTITSGPCCHKPGAVQAGTLGETCLCFEAPFKWVALGLLL